MPPFVPDVSCRDCALNIILIILQSNKANFDATHELEELLLEDNPLKARRRNPNQDINNLSAEMRQLEEQSVTKLYLPSCLVYLLIHKISRFTNYDYEKMKRRSYYPTNQQIVSSITASSSAAGPSRPSTPAAPVAMDGRDVHTTSVNVPPLPRTHMISMEKEPVAI